MTCDAISKATCSSGSGSGARGARGAERRESDTGAGVRVRYARLGARRGCAVGGGAWAWVGGGGAEDDRVRWVQRARGSGSGARGARHRQHTSGSIANTFLTQSQTHPRDKRAPPYLSTLAPLSRCTVAIEAQLRT